jgi:3-deoxy-manno-octulosonate cytidylyltransferase (CMP-KDO synthetase)
VESHGIKSPLKKTIAVIPARFASTRLEGKLLLPLGGEPIVVRTARQAASSQLVDLVVVATDDIRIADAVESAGFQVVMTSQNHPTGSDRIAEAVSGMDVDVIVNVQADEPFISPETIDSAVIALTEAGVDFATTCEEITDPSDVLNPNVVKVVTDRNGFALYFSRSPIPFPRNEVIEFGSLDEALKIRPGLISMFRKHTGLYVFTPAGLRAFTNMPKSPLEKFENLEQLRILENGFQMKVVETGNPSIGIDTEDDYKKALEMIGDGPTVS